MISSAAFNSGDMAWSVAAAMAPSECGTVSSLVFYSFVILSDSILVRTGQAHRTLLGHTAPITCLQFDELHIATGSLDQTMRLWDLRTGGVVETMQFDHPVTSLQFDTRKIVAAAGESGVKVQSTFSAYFALIVLIHRS